jgi:hypothetical protein
LPRLTSVTSEENNTNLLEIFIVGKGVEEEVVESVLQLQQVLGKQEKPLANTTAEIHILHLV